METESASFKDRLPIQQGQQQLVKQQRQWLAAGRQTRVKASKPAGDAQQKARSVLRASARCAALAWAEVGVVSHGRLNES